MKQIKVKLNSKSIQNAIKELENYKASLEAKNKEFVSRLIDYGIEMAESYSGSFGKHIVFSKKVEGGENAVGFLIAKGEPITVEWIVRGDSGEEVKTAEIDPLLMAEFGSGQFAEVLFDISGVGRGTFPGQTHAFDDSWSFKKEAPDGTTKWYRSSGVAPTHPMYHADMEMLDMIESIAREVFSNV